MMLVDFGFENDKGGEGLEVFYGFSHINHPSANVTDCLLYNWISYKKIFHYE